MSARQRYRRCASCLLRASIACSMTKIKLFGKNAAENVNIYSFVFNLDVIYLIWPITCEFKRILIIMLHNVIMHDGRSELLALRIFVWIVPGETYTKGII